MELSTTDEELEIAKKAVEYIGSYIVRLRWMGHVRQFTYYLLLKRSEVEDGMGE